MPAVLATREATVTRRGKPETKPVFKTVEEEVRYWNLIGAEVEDESAHEEREHHLKETQVVFRNGGLATSRTFILDDGDDADAW
jgi:hypothetical protein